MSDHAWLKDLKIGDEVIVVGHGFGGRTRIATVSRFTKNFIVVLEPKPIGGGETKFRIESGWEPGPGYHHDQLQQATPEAVAELREKIYRVNFQNKLDHLKWDDVPLERIKEIREIVEPYIGQKENSHGL